MRLFSDDNQYIKCKEMKADSLNILTKDRLKILELLNSEPMYPVQIAKITNMQVQTIYYHMKILEKSGLIEFSGYEEKQGGVAKKYIAAADSIAIVLNKNGWRKGKHISKKEVIPKLLQPFMREGFFDGKMILGSPDPHGKYRARGSELSMVEVGMLLGQYGTFSFPGYLLDTEIKPKDRKQNLILAGGPKVNMLVNEINKQLPIRFEESTFDVYSTLSKKKYGENVGLIELINSPFYKRSKILLIGGLNYHGTRAAVLGLIKKMNKIEEGNIHNSSIMAKVVEGYDDDGDGVVDSVEILE